MPGLPAGADVFLERREHDVENEVPARSEHVGVWAARRTLVIYANKGLTATTDEHLRMVREHEGLRELEGSDRRLVSDGAPRELPAENGTGRELQKCLCLRQVRRRDVEGPVLVGV